MSSRFAEITNVRFPPIADISAKHLNNRISPAPTDQRLTAQLFLNVDPVGGARSMRQGGSRENSRYLGNSGNFDRRDQLR
jgi:hypothetical protein